MSCKEASQQLRSKFNFVNWDLAAETKAIVQHHNSLHPDLCIVKEMCETLKGLQTISVSLIISASLLRQERHTFLLL